DTAFLATMAGAIARLGVDRALIVSSEDGLDEVSATAPTSIVEVNGEELSEYVLDPLEVGIRPTTGTGAGGPGGDPQQNAAVTLAILRGEHPPGEELAVINAGAAIYTAGRAETISEGVREAQLALADGSAAAALESYLQASLRHAPQEAAR
ncbi:MAG TPA: anthranilate phosphoribosyltransferase, partial [Solirubrobacteraceae bacterium]|nr:anthranilate phosphoribosyltransferase [Solirubrobacteraceae bacterium]